MIKNKRIRKSKNFDELLDAQYGKIGTKKRDEFETRAQYFVISEMLKDARREANLTQEQLADKVGTKKSYISRLENGSCDIQLSTLYRIFEDGLGKKISLIIAWGKIVKEAIRKFTIITDSKNTAIKNSRVTKFKY